MTPRRKIGSDTPPYGEWEDRLSRTFSPIDPDPVFVNRLRQRLEEPAEIYIERAITRRALAAGLLSAAVALLFLFAWFLMESAAED